MRGAPQEPARALLAGAPAQDAPGRLVTPLELLLEPALEGAVEEAVRDLARRDREHRVDPGLHRSLAQQVGAESVNRPDARLLELAERAVQRLARARAARLLDRPPEAELQLTGRRVRERDRDHLVEPRATGGEQRDHPGHELRRLARARSRLDDERCLEVVADAVARGLVGERRHGMLRRRVRSAARSGGFRFVRASSWGPQTGR